MKIAIYTNENDIKVVRVQWNYKDSSTYTYLNLISFQK